MNTFAFLMMILSAPEPETFIFMHKNEILQFAEENREEIVKYLEELELINDYEKYNFLLNYTEGEWESEDACYPPKDEQLANMAHRYQYSKNMPTSKDAARFNITIKELNDFDKQIKEVKKYFVSRGIQYPFERNQCNEIIEYCERLEIIYSVISASKSGSHILYESRDKLDFVRRTLGVENFYNGILPLPPRVEDFER